MKSDAVSANRLLNALNNEEFEPYIQPVVRASDLTVSGGELLVRWHMPEGKIHLPRRFINWVESAGLLPAMTQKNNAAGSEQTFRNELYMGSKLPACRKCHARSSCGQ